MRIKDCSSQSIKASEMIVKLLYPAVVDSIGIDMERFMSSTLFLKELSREVPHVPQFCVSS